LRARFSRGDNRHRVQLATLVETSAAVAANRARSRKLAALGACLSELAGDEIEIGCAFLAGELRQGRIGIGWAGIRDAAPQVRVDQPSLTLSEVDHTFAAIARVSGRGSAGERLRLLRALFARATADEQAFLSRLLLGELRQGAQEGVLIEAVAAASGVPVERVRRAAMLGGSLFVVATAALADGEPGLARFRLELFRPLQPMLAQTAEHVADALARLGGRAAFEWKLDGARVQVHREGDRVRVFTRAGNEVTDAAPEVVEAAASLAVRSLVLDGEALAFDAGGRPLPFQVSMRRFGRRQDVAALRREIPLACRFFDCLHVDGEDVTTRAAADRQALLEARVPEALRVPRLVTADPAEAERFLAGALAAGHEGVMAKSLGAAYEAGRRGGDWLKLKPAHTLDLVVLAAEWGSGRRRGWLSNLHLGARDPATGGFVMLGKTFKGMTDELLAWQTDRLQQLALRREGHVVHVEPALVVEIAFDGVQASPHYPGGVALRFARVKGYREDKRPEQADTLASVRALMPRAARPEPAAGSSDPHR
jgi:DNA ligase-1